jgi:hypothetical protein
LDAKRSNITTVENANVPFAVFAISRKSNPMISMCKMFHLQTPITASVQLFHLRKSRIAIDLLRALYDLKKTLRARDARGTVTHCSAEYKTRHKVVNWNIRTLGKNAS